VARRKYWDLYEDCAHLLPRFRRWPMRITTRIRKRIFDANDWRSFDITEETSAASRRAYFANISYLDDKIGEILDVLDATRQEAIVVFVSDHGDMLGERGLWFKMSFYEGSARVPLMIAAPGVAPGAVDDPVSTIDVCPTLCDLAGVDMARSRPGPTAKASCRWPGGARGSPVAMEYAAEASDAPLVALRYGQVEIHRCALDPEQLFDLEADPHELREPRRRPGPCRALAGLRAKAEARWDLDRLRRRGARKPGPALGGLRGAAAGRVLPVGFPAAAAASERYMRNHMDLNVLEENQRFPRGD
jgi:choline-sulfatase